jgi:hypothetical protein
MEDKLAKFFSYLLHPLLMPALAILLFMNSSTVFTSNLDFNDRMVLFSMVLISTLLLPLVIILFMYFQGMISSLTMENRKDRILPFFTISIFYYFTYYFLARYPLPHVFFNILMGAFFTSILVLIISYFWKISAHTAGLGGLAGCLWALSIRLQIDFTLFFAASILIAGIAGWARLKLNAHSQTQIYLGFAAGVAVMFFTIIYR